jgi:hypothetical protein
VVSLHQLPPPKLSPTPAEIKAKKVRPAISKAERSVTIFDLDLGQVPVLNKDTLCRKVTLQLHGLAKTKGMYKEEPAAAEEAIDDLLSCANLDFLGKGSTRFNNKKDVNDPRNGKMCTVPVKLTWRDKESRSMVEQTLRKSCKIRCGIPYPKKLRSLIRETVEAGRRLHPDTFIKVKVEIDKLRLSTSARTQDGWVNLDLTPEIPLDILDNDELAAVAMDDESEMANIS